MPKLHRREDGCFYVVSYEGDHVTWQINSLGLEYLLDRGASLDKERQEIDHDDFNHLKRERLIYIGGNQDPCRQTLSEGLKAIRWAKSNVELAVGIVRWLAEQIDPPEVDLERTYSVRRQTNNAAGFYKVKAQEKGFRDDWLDGEAAINAAIKTGRVVVRRLAKVVDD